MHSGNSHIRIPYVFRVKKTSHLFPIRILLEDIESAGYADIPAIWAGWSIDATTLRPARANADIAAYFLPRAE